MKPWQKTVTETITQDDDNITLLVRPIGDGKSLVRNAAALHVRGVTLTIVPLLTLGIDQGKKMETKIKLSGLHNVFVYHLDEICASPLLSSLLDSLEDLADNTLSTIFCLRLLKSCCKTRR